MIQEKLNVLVKLLAANCCLITVAFGAEAYPIAEIPKAQMEINDFIASAVKDKEKRKLVTDYSAIEKALPLPSEELSNQLLLSVFNSQSQIEFLLKKASWITVAKIKRNESVISSAMMLAGLKQKLQLKAMIDMMSNADRPESDRIGNEGVWDFDHYQPVLEVNENEMFLRLVAYMFEKSPQGAVNYYLKNEADDFTQEQRKTVATKTNSASSIVLKHTSSIKYTNAPASKEVVNILLDLTKYEKWYLDAYVAIMLKDMHLDNVSPEISAYLNSKEGSLAYRIKHEKKVIYSSIPQPQVIQKLIELNNKKAEASSSNLHSRKSKGSTSSGDTSGNENQKNTDRAIDDDKNSKEFISKWPFIAATIFALGALLFLIKSRKK